tara:strand:- start:326 stop:1048 length:723 start_codon:yes stop_codon:yes gene_type:complete
MSSYSSDCEIIILAGGLGTRLNSVQSNTPKAMSIINGKPFIDILIDFYLSQGFRRFIILVGHLKNHIINHLSKRKNITILFSEENTPLGTGGALVRARKLFKSKIQLVINGDSFCGINIKELVNFHLNCSSDISIVVRSSMHLKEYGSITFNENKRIISFNEKQNIKQGFINCGVYVLSSKIIDLIPSKIKSSLEYDFFPNNLDRRIYAFETKKELIDIGTPERLKKASSFFKYFNHEKR